MWMSTHSPGCRRLRRACRCSPCARRRRRRPGRAGRRTRRPSRRPARGCRGTCQALLLSAGTRRYASTRPAPGPRAGRRPARRDRRRSARSLVDGRRPGSPRRSVGGSGRRALQAGQHRDRVHPVGVEPPARRSPGRPPGRDLARRGLGRARRRPAPARPTRRAGRRPGARRGCRSRRRGRRPGGGVPRAGGPPRGRSRRRPGRGCRRRRPARVRTPAAFVGGLGLPADLDQVPLPMSGTDRTDPMARLRRGRADDGGDSADGSHDRSLLSSGVQGSSSSGAKYR